MKKKDQKRGLSRVLGFIASLSIFGFGLLSCERPTEPEYDSRYDERSVNFVASADLSTKEVTDIGALTAKSGGLFTNNFGKTVNQKGVCWSTEQSPVVDEFCSSDGTGFGEFTSNIANLLPETRYFVRAYATNSRGTIYGEQRVFTTTDGSITLTTNEASSVGALIAQIGGNITDDGGAAITQRGVCYATSQNPTTSDTCMSAGQGSGSFTANLSGLSPETQYYVHAYATNAAGTSLGNEQTFTTRSGIPVVTTIAPSAISKSSARVGGEVVDIGVTITARGICYIEGAGVPGLANTCVSDGSGTGNFDVLIENLIAGQSYSVRAYATSEFGTGWGEVFEFIAFDTQVVDVTNSITGRTWMDRNLGATRVATSSTDTQSYGDLYQWGRWADGHEKRNSTTTTTKSSTDQPGHGSFILAPNSPWDWRSPQNNTLWQGVSGVNNPCPAGYRLPSEAEWDSERTSWSANTSAGAFASPLKLPVAGYRSSISDSLNIVGSNGFYWSWSGSVSGSVARYLGFGSSSAEMSSDKRARGRSVRCLKD